MSFEFDYDTAIRFRWVLDELGEDVGAAKSYIAGYADFGIAGTGLINTLRSGHSEASGAVESQLRHIREYLTSTLSEFMGETFSVYKDEEDDVQARLRALEGEFQAEANMMGDRREGEDYSAEEDSPGTGYAPQVDPRESLTEVEAGTDSVYSRQEPEAVLDHFSISLYIRTILTTLGFTDPFEWLGTKLAGDWDKFTEYGMALRNVADCIDGVADNLRGHVDQLEASWSGNAYAACNVAIYHIADQMHEGTAEPLRTLAGHYEEAAEIAVEAYHSLEPFMGIIADAATGIGIFTAITQGIRKLADTIGEAIDDATGVIGRAQASLEVVRIEFVEVEFVPLDELSGPSGSDRTENLEILTENGLPMVLEKYEQQ